MRLNKQSELPSSNYAKSSFIDTSPDADNLCLTPEFKSAAINLIHSIQSQELRLFLSQKIGLYFEEYVGANCDYLALFEKSRNSRLGAFYTPQHLVDQIISKIEIIPGQKYLEPGVGTGNFILSLVKNILKSYPSVKLSDLLNSIYGFDLDWEALELCKIRLLLELEKHFDINISTCLNLNLQLSDFTVKTPKQLSLFQDLNVMKQDSEKVRDIKSNLKFDYIFGNPPFVTFYGRRSKKLPESHRQYYLTNYDFIPESVKNGKLNLYMFFIENGLNLLKEGGHLIYLLDNSIYESSSYHLRKWLIENFQIESIIIGLAGFDRVVSGQTIWHITKTNPQKYVYFYDVFAGLSHEVNQKNWLDNPECKIDLSPSSSILDKFNSYKQLIDYFPGKSIRTCCMLLDLTEKFLTDKEEYEKDTSGLIMPYLEGSKSLSSPDEPFKFSNYIKYNYDLQLRLSDEIKIKLEKEGIKNKKRIGLGKLEIYQSPKIFIRQSSERLIAKFTNERFMANNSLYLLTPIYSNFSKKDWEKVLIYTERLLCSKLYLYLAYKLKVIRRNIKQQPQIKVSDLRRLPFWIDERSKFFSIVANMEPINRDEIDRIIYNKYNLSDEEINEIEYFSHTL